MRFFYRRPGNYISDKGRQCVREIHSAMKQRRRCASVVFSDVLAVTLMVLLVAKLSISQVILNPPKSKVIFPNQSAIYACEVAGGYTSWRVNGLQTNDLSSELLMNLEFSFNNTEDGNALDILSIKARAEYNGTTFQCVTFGDFSQQSGNVSLTIQGLLSAADHLTIFKNTSSLTVSWTAPFSLDVTGVDPDIWYSVLIYNVTDENNPTAILCTDCTSITETHYTFTPDYLSPCHTMSFIVIPFNGAGQGESSGNTTFKSCDEISISFTRTDIRAGERNCIVIFHFSGEGERVRNYTLLGVSGANELVQYGPLENEDDVSYLLPPNNNYSTFFEVNYLFGTKILSNEYFTTYDVQNMLAVVEDGGIRVTGEFISDSHAKGCFIVLQGNSTTADIYQALQRNGPDQNFSSYISVPPSLYTIYGYDIEQSAFPNSIPAGVIENRVVVSSEYKPAKISSRFLKNTTISQSGSKITIDCQFVEDYPKASCVLVYREYDSPLLKTAEFYHFFPVTLTVHNPEKYTFAVFGRNSVFEEEPALCVKFGKTTMRTFSDEENKSSLNIEFVAVSIGAVAFGIISVVLAAVVVKLCHSKSSQAKESRTAATNAVYDYVGLPLSSSPAVHTKPNNAYATTSEATCSIHTETKAVTT